MNTDLCHVGSTSTEKTETGETSVVRAFLWGVLITGRYQVSCIPRLRMIPSSSNNWAKDKKQPLTPFLGMDTQCTVTSAYHFQVSFVFIKNDTKYLVWPSAFFSFLLFFDMTNISILGWPAKKNHFSILLVRLEEPITVTALLKPDLAWFFYGFFSSWICSLVFGAQRSFCLLWHDCVLTLNTNIFH